MNDNIKLLYIDLFCGAGGTSTGVENARLNGQKCAKVIACVNHDPNAIASHAANHPEVLHFTEDIRTLRLRPLAEHAARMRDIYPEAKLVLWASLECTNFSKAKGGMPRDADSRTLAEHLFRYIEALQPDYIQIENVEEFMCWGDLDEKGKPVSRDKGCRYVKWVKKVCSYGYRFDKRILNAADYGAYTSRRRFFGQFARKGLPMAFPMPTHSKDGGDDLFHHYEHWKPVREVLDLEDEGESIFTRRKPLVEKTLERIYAGLVKFVAGGRKSYLVKWNSTNGKTGKYVPPSVDEPSPTVTCQNRLGLAQVSFLSKQFGGEPSGKNIGLDQPAGTVTCKDHHAFVTAYYGNGFSNSLEEPAPTVTTKDRLSVVTPEFIVNYRFNNPGGPVDKSAPTICTAGQIGVAQCKFLDKQYGNGTPTSLEDPSPTIVNNPKQRVVSSHFLMNPYSFKSDGSSIDKPCFTLIASMDKMPPYLITTKEGVLGIAIYESDTYWMRKIKEFMALYGIVDICMRMLKIEELKRIMGFPTGYVLVGTMAEQKKYIGNAVEVNMSRVLCEALCRKLVIEHDKKIAI